VEWLIGQIDEKMKKLGADRPNLDLRSKVLRLCDVYLDVKDLGVNIIREDGITASSSRERIRLYFLAFAGKKIDAIEIEVVSGISEYGRRLRELRREDGYQIASGASPDPESGINLRPDEYLLVTKEPDTDAARRWHVANRIRKSRTGSKEKILEFLRENVGKVVTTDELAYVAGKAKQYARRLRELRTEDGYSIATHFTGRPDLAIGQYILQSLDRINEPHDRHIPSDVQKEIYERDENTCRICGWITDRWTIEDPRILELHHLTHHQDKGPNTPENLIVVCSKCHDEIHKGKHRKILDEIMKSLCRMYSQKQNENK